MVSELPNLKDESRFSISQTCKILGVCYNTLMSKTIQGFIKSGVRSDGKQFYTGKAIKDFFYSLIM